MAPASITIKGGDKLKRKIARVVPEVERDLRSDLIDEARAIVDAAVAEVEKPKHGRTYHAKRRGSGIRYAWTASAPGEAPAKRTGEKVKQVRAARWNPKFKPGAKVLFPIIFRLLERGMKSIEPRPLFGPIMAKARDKIRDRVERTTARVLNATISRK